MLYNENTRFIMFTGIIGNAWSSEKCLEIAVQEVSFLKSMI